MLNNESMEMYLETILRLCKSNEKVRAVDIANQMRISKVSVCHAIKNLQAKDYVTYESRLIRLTKKGRILAEEIYERHCELTKLLISLGVDSATAEQDACRIEHCISQETFNAVKRYNEVWTFVINFDEAEKYRKLRGGFLRKNQWRDLTVHVFV